MVLLHCQLSSIHGCRVNGRMAHRAIVQKAEIAVGRPSIRFVVRKPHRWITLLSDCLRGSGARN
jgi:hypothetical protein